MTVVEDIKERLDIVEVISAYVPLRKAGRIYKALCPFHQEKTPSFVVYPDTGTWRCFGACGAGGDVFAFVMKRENVDFREALEILAVKAGVSLSPPSPAASQHEQHLDRLREINQAAALYFHSLLKHGPKGQVARDYLASRGLDQATVDGFQLGYASEGWDGLLSHLLSKNYQLEDIVAAGLVIERTQEGSGRAGAYDRFRHRLMVPIRDVRGHVVGFGARALNSDQQPKYLNTSQTPLFDKSSVLFGLDAAHKAIRARGQAVIVEGYMDVLACHQFGENNVVASMGTALAEQQLKQLKRYTDTLILALDADMAGEAATLRGIAQVREAMDRDWVPTITGVGLVRHEARLAADLRIMTLPKGQDPDDVMRADPARWQELVRQARPVVDYFFDLARRELDLNTAQGKSEAVERLAPLIHEVADDVKRAHYAQQLARMTQTDERTVERLIKQRSPTTSRPIQPALVPAPESTGAAAEPASGRSPGAQRTTTLNASAHCLSLLVLHPDLLPDLQAELVRLGVGPLDEDDFSHTQERAVCEALLAGALDHVSSPGIVDWLGKLRSHADRQPVLPRVQLLKDVVDSVLHLRIDTLKARTRELPALVRAAEDDDQPDEARHYRQLHTDLGQQRRQLEHILNLRTYAGRRQAASSTTTSVA